MKECCTGCLPFDTFPYLLFSALLCTSRADHQGSKYLQNNEERPMGNVNQRLVAEGETSGEVLLFSVLSHVSYLESSVCLHDYSFCLFLQSFSSNRDLFTLSTTCLCSFCPKGRNSIPQ